MPKFLIVYGTKEGQTCKIAEHIKTLMSNRGYQADLNNAEKFPSKFSFEGYTGILVGASIHRGFFSPAAKTFITQHKSSLEAVPSAFYSVSLSDANPKLEERAKLDPYIKSLFKKTGWKPVSVGRFGGALPYTKYGWLTKFIMTKIAGAQGQPTDTSKDYVFTEWDKVDKFGDEVIQKCLDAEKPSTNALSDPGK
jgi:menaquinone-dependent protoporphyrinogen oxidase